MHPGDHSIDNAQLAALARRLNRPIALVGLMGVGKSTVGRKLAALLDIPFIDADDEIERAAQRSIPEIFAEYGEPAFRDGERRVISRLIEDGHNAPKVIATGGGAFCQETTRELLKSQTVTVWIDSDVPTLVARTAKRENRPLLKGGDPAEILSRLRDERAPHYAQAHIHVFSDNGPHLHTALAILKELDACL